MQEELKKDDGWMSLEVLTRFNRLKVLSTDIDEIITALKSSESGLLEVKRVFKAHNILINLLSLLNSDRRGE